MLQRHQLQSTLSSGSASSVGEGRKRPEYLSDVPPTLLLLEWIFCSHSRDGVSSCSWKRLWATSRFQQSKTMGLKLVLQLRFSTKDSTWFPQENLIAWGVMGLDKSENFIWYESNINFVTMIITFVPSWNLWIGKMLLIILQTQVTFFLSLHISNHGDSIPSRTQVFISNPK